MCGGMLRFIIIKESCFANMQIRQLVYSMTVRSGKPDLGFHAYYSHYLHPKVERHFYDGALNTTDKGNLSMALFVELHNEHAATTRHSYISGGPQVTNGLLL